MERRIIRIVIAMSSIHCSSAKIDDIFTVKFKIRVLKSDLCHILISVIVQITHDLPLPKVGG